MLHSRTYKHQCSQSFQCKIRQLNFFDVFSTRDKFFKKFKINPSFIKRKHAAVLPTSAVLKMPKKIHVWPYVSQQDIVTLMLPKHSVQNEISKKYFNVFLTRDKFCKKNILKVTLLSVNGNILSSFQREQF